MSSIDKLTICDQYIFENINKWKSSKLDDIHVGVMREGESSNWKVKFDNFELDNEQVKHFLIRMRATFSDTHEKLLEIHDKINQATLSLSDAWEWKHTLNDIKESRKISDVLHSIDKILKTKLLNLPPSVQDKIKTMTTYIYSPRQNLNSIETTYESILEQCIYQTLDWEKKIQLFPIEIDRLIEKTQAEEKFVTAPSGWTALTLAASIGDVAVIDKLKTILGNKLSNAINQGKSLPLTTAILEGQYLFTEALCIAGADVNARNKNYEPIFHSIIRSCNPEAVNYYLNLNGVDVNCKDEYKNTPLHIACHLSNPKIFELLLNNPSLAKQIHEKDLFGRTPLDVALQNKCDDIIRLLLPNSEKDPKTLPGYGKKIPEINQGIILTQLTKFLNIKKIQDEQKLKQDNLASTLENLKKIRDASVLPSGGHCNGLSFLFQYYAQKGKEQEFYYILNLFSEWDGLEESLKSTEKIIHLSGNYKDLEDLMEQWINDIIWFQHNAASLPYGQLNRVRQFEISNKYLSDSVSPIKRFNFQFTKEQLAEWLNIHSQFSGNIIEITGSRHATGLRVLEDGSCLYYDPNILYALPPFKSMDSLAEVIQEIKYLSIGENGDKMDIILQIYKILDESNKHLPEFQSQVPEIFKKTKSLNGYSPLHLAILYNDKELFDRELTKAEGTFNEPNLLGQTPFQDAVIYGRNDCVKALIKHPKFELSKHIQNQDLLKIAIIMGNYDIANSLIDNNYEITGEHIIELVEVNQKDLLVKIFAKGMDSSLLNTFSFDYGRPLHIAIEKRDSEMIKLLLNNGADIRETGLFPVMASILSSIASIRDITILQSILPMLPKFNECDKEGSNLLHYAVINQNTWLVSYLVEKGADISLQNAQGKTAQDLANDSKNQSIIDIIESIIT